MTDVDDRRPVEDVVCDDGDYQRLYRDCRLEPVATYRPLGRDDEPIEWVNEARIPPWVIYVQRASSD